jgi:putative glutamine amidotransferase
MAIKLGMDSNLSQQTTFFPTTIPLSSSLIKKTTSASDSVFENLEKSHSTLESFANYVDLTADLMQVASILSSKKPIDTPKLIKAATLKYLSSFVFCYLSNKQRIFVEFASCSYRLYNSLKPDNMTTIAKESANLTLIGFKLYSDVYLLPQFSVMVQLTLGIVKALELAETLQDPEADEEIKQSFEYRSLKSLSLVLQILCSSIKFQQKALQGDFSKIVRYAKSKKFDKDSLEQCLEKVKQRTDLTKLTDSSKTEIMEKVLEEENLYPYISNQDFNNGDLSYKILSNLTFYKCRFKENYATAMTVLDSKFGSCLFMGNTFNKTVWENVTHLDCNFDTQNYPQSSYKNVTHINSFFSSCMFAGLDSNNVHYIDSIFSDVGFFLESCADTTFTNCDLEKSFIETIKGMTFCSKTELPDSSLPIAIAATSDQNVAGGNCALTALEILSKKVITLYASPFDLIKDENTQEQIENLIKKQRPVSRLRNKKESIVQRLLSSNAPIIKKIEKACQRIFKHADLIFIPGSCSDVNPMFYGKANETYQEGKHTYFKSNPNTQSLFELFQFSVIKYAQDKKTPLFGICRGAQLLNVFHGGTLIQNVANKDFLSPINLKKLLPFDFDTKIFTALSLHHQAVDELGRDIQIIGENDDCMIKIINHKSGSIGIQFHPELILNKSSFLKKLFNDPLKQAFFSFMYDSFKDFKGLEKGLEFSKAFFDHLVETAQKHHGKSKAA